MINLSHVNKYYNKGKNNELHVINDCNITLPDKGLITILGESGSGKTTLLNVIGGLDKAKGTITYDDKEFNGYKMSKIDKYRRENVGYIFQNYNLLPELTIYGNLELALNLVDIIDKDEVDKRVKMALEAVGLYKFRKKPAGKLSGGQMQRVAIARALVKECKILIADEPTGNLDSTNSIEIMNILKKLSETTLVILVTHDKTLAEFYSSQIIELTDGKVVNIREAHGNISLQNKNENKIYLKDMNQSQVEGENIKSVVFSDEEKPNIDITLVEKNGTYYIKSNVKIKLLEETNLLLIDDNYHETTIDEYQNDLKYDTSSYDNTKRSKSAGRIWNLIKNGFIDFFIVAKKKTKFFRFVFILIGVVLGFMAALFCRYAHKDYSNVINESNIYVCDKTDGVNYTDYTNALNKMIDDEAIKTASLYSKTDCNVIYQLNSIQEKKFSGELNTLTYDVVADKGLEYGHAPAASGEIVLGKKLANRILKKYKFTSYEQMLKLVKLDSGSIVGVSKSNTNTVYSYNSILSPSSDIYKNEPATGKDVSSVFTLNTEFSYTIYDGQDLTAEDKNTRNVVIIVPEGNTYNPLTKTTSTEISASYDMYWGEGTCDITIQDKQFTCYDRTYNIVGVAQSNYLTKGIDYSFVTANYKEITYQMNNLLESEYGVLYDLSGLGGWFGTPHYNKESISSFGNNYNIIDGRAPKYVNECMVSPYFGLEIGEKIKNSSGFQYTVTGIYEMTNDYYDENNVATFVVSDISALISYSSSVIVAENASAVKKAFKDNNINFYNLRSNQIAKINKAAKKSNISTLSIMASLFAIALVYIYFTMRSKLISDIYEVGVLRNLGASKKRIYSRYIVELTLTTLFTTLLGYLLTIFIYGIIWEKLGHLTSLFPQYSIIKSPYPYIGIILIFAMHIFIGLLPTILLLRKTPSEISSKYDI